MPKRPASEYRTPRGPFLRFPWKEQGVDLLRARTGLSSYLVEHVVRDVLEVGGVLVYSRLQTWIPGRPRLRGRAHFCSTSPKSATSTLRAPTNCTGLRLQPSMARATLHELAGVAWRRGARLAPPATRRSCHLEADAARPAGDVDRLPCKALHLRCSSPGQAWFRR
jgi:hypothetical protein